MGRNRPAKDFPGGDGISVWAPVLFFLGVMVLALVLWLAG